MISKTSMRATAALTFALLSAGCFEMKQDFKFKSDGTADVSMRIAVDAAIIAFASKDKPKDWCGKGFKENEGTTVRFESATEGADSVCLVSMSGSIDDVVKALSKADSGSSAKQTIALTREGDLYQLAIVLPPFGETEEPKDNPLVESMQAMMLAKMSGRVLAWSVSAPKIVETTGTLSEDGTNASYSRPLAEAFTSKEPTKFSAKFSLEEPGVFGWIKSLFQ